MVRLQTALIILVTAMLTCGCGIVPRSEQRPVQIVSTTDTSNEDSATPVRSDSEPSSNELQPPPVMMVSSVNEAKASLMQAYRDWKGTPYVLGGTSKNGVDCSKLVNIIFDDYFGIKLPGNTRSQLNAGDGIRRAAVRTGDLVFFRTGRKTLHVGIAVNRGEFLHASTSNGVMISKLGNSYWRNRFLAARRVF